MILRLTPMDDSYDQVLIRDVHGTACGMVHMDTWMEQHERGEIYRRLWDGKEAIVEVKLAEENEDEDRDGEEEAEASDIDLRAARNR